jgi:putative phosphoesterase
MYRLIVFSDLHANLPALQAALDQIQTLGYDEIVHLGDAIAIGPYPAECLESLKTLTNASYLMGNHDACLVDGLPQPIPESMSAGEVEHQHWVHGQISSKLVSFVAEWPYQIIREYDAIRVSFQHYALDASGSRFLPLIKHPTPQDLDHQYLGSDAQVVFHGHTHIACDLTGARRYINPGSMGCYHHSVARYCSIDFHRGGFEIQHFAVAYDDAELYKAFESRQVPERNFLYQAFYAGRFPR